MSMKLYLVKRKDEDDISWDEYIGGVIAANSVEEAKQIMGALESVHTQAVWTGSLIAEIAHPSVKRGVVLDSFNAG